MATTFKKATKEQAKLRLALFGVSGSGKTYSALRLASGLGEKIALIDTENRSASKYSDRFDFDVAECKNPTIENIKLIINDAKGYDVLIIDNLTHVWLELLQEVELIARTKFGGNSWSAWSQGTSKQRSLIDAILNFPGHIIATMRAETNWTTQVNDRGKVEPVRIGEAPKQGKGIEYEFDMLMQLESNHSVVVLKDRTGKYQDKLIEIIDENLGRELSDWLSDGVIPQENVTEPTTVEPNFSDLLEKITSCQTVEELNKLYTSLHKPVDSDTTNLFRLRKQAIEEEVKKKDIINI